MKPFSNPILICGDNPCHVGGLARSGRDIAQLLTTMPEVRVAYLGRGIGQDNRFKFWIYDFHESGQWGEGYIEYAWKNFSDGEEGVILTTDDLSRRHWFSNPVGLPEDLARFLGDSRNFQKWAYVPLDSAGPSGRTLPTAGRDCLRGFDRVLAASHWAQEVFIQSGREDAEWLPHGIWPERFHIVENAREQLGWKPGEIHVGAVMANQERKDFPAVFECFRHLEDRYGERFRGWLHTDVPIRNWNIYALAVDYGVERTDVTFELTDLELATYYSACHATLLPSGGEGFGYPIAESMACGTACVVTDYAGGAELVEPSCRIEPLTYRVETPYNCLRAINAPHRFSLQLMEEIAIKEDDWQARSRQVAGQVEHLHWPCLKDRWINWIERGLKPCRAPS